MIECNDESQTAAAKFDALRQLPDLAEFRFLLRSFLSFSETQADAAGITVQQYQMLQVLGNAEVGGCSISALARRLLLRHNSAVELVDRGERSGLVVRTADAADQRLSMVQMTPHGRALLARLVQAHLEYLRAEGPGLAVALGRLTGSEPVEAGRTTAGRQERRA